MGLLSKKPKSLNQRSSSDARKTMRRARVVRSNVGSSRISKTKKPGNVTFKRYILAFVVVMVLFWTGYTGSDISVKANSAVVQKDVSAAANGYLSGLKNWWWFVSEKELLADIEQSSTFVASAKIRRNIFTRNLIVEVEEREPSLRARVAKQQFIVATDGVVLEASEQGESLPLIYDESDLPSPEIGSRYLPKSLVVQVNLINDLLSKNKNLAVKEFVLPDNTREVRAETKQGFYIKFNTTDDAQKQIADLQRVESKIPKGATYVDVRFSGKIFIK